MKPTEPGWYWVDQWANDDWVPAHVYLEEDEWLEVAIAGSAGDSYAMSDRWLRHAKWGPRIPDPPKASE